MTARWLHTSPPTNRYSQRNEPEMDRVSEASDPSPEADDSRPVHGVLSIASNISFDTLCKVALILCIIEVFGGGGVSAGLAVL